MLVLLVTSTTHVIRNATGRTSDNPRLQDRHTHVLSRRDFYTIGTTMAGSLLEPSGVNEIHNPVATPVKALLRPLHGHAAAVRKAAIGDTLEARPKGLEHSPMLTYLSLSFRPPFPVDSLPWAAPSARDTAPQHDVRAKAGVGYSS